MAAATTADSGHATLPEPGNVLEGRFRYQLERNLGSGGFGAVYAARCLDADSGRPGAPPAEVAVKLLGPAHDPSARSFLKREVSALLAVEHDRIPKLYDWSLQGEDNFVVLEYFAEGSLADARSSISRLDEDQTWRLLTDLLSALSAAHRASILHLDVKPSNVLLDGEGGYILTDFGVSQGSRMSKGLLHQGQIPIGLGTHGYRAPEQDSTRVQTFDLRTDLWGVGVTAWSMYTGIDLNKRHDVLRTGVPGNIYGLPRLSDVHLRCPPPLEEVVMGLLTIQPSARPGGTAEVLSQIRAIASGFGMPSQAVASAHRNETSAAEAQQVVDDLADPLWASICRAPGFQRFLVRYEDGALISGNGEQAHNALLLLRGSVAVEKRGQRVGVEEREGTILSAIATLTDAPRSVTLRAQGETWVCVFNEAELEQLLTSNPAVALRMIRTFANRIVAGPPRHRD